MGSSVLVSRCYRNVVVASAKLHHPRWNGHTRPLPRLLVGQFSFETFTSRSLCLLLRDNSFSNRSDMGCYGVDTRRSGGMVAIIFATPYSHRTNCRNRARPNGRICRRLVELEDLRLQDRPLTCPAAVDRRYRNHNRLEAFSPGQAGRPSSFITLPHRVNIEG